MTHYKKHWLLLLAKRLNDGNRVIIKKELIADFLCYCLKCDFLHPHTPIKIIQTTNSLIITKN
jgi:hypothetical protein